MTELTAVEWAYAACRLIHFATMMLVFGGLGFLVAAPLRLLPALAGDARRPLAGLGAAALVSGGAIVALQAIRMTGDVAAALQAGTLLAVLRQTAFGEAWTWHLFWAVVLCGVLAVWVHGTLRPPRIALAAATLLLASAAFTGHAAAGTGSGGWVWRTGQALHLLAAGAWLGGLPPVLRCLLLLRAPATRTAAALAVRRFSLAGHAAVAVVVATGVANACFVLGPHWPADTTSTYVRLLLAKVVLVAAMVGIAIYNRYGIVPRWSRNPAGAGRALARGTLAELAAGAIVLALVSVFASMDPA